MIKLDEQQKLAVESPAKNIVVVAGAGSGKTTVLTERIRFLLEHGAPSNKIVAITFTNMAAEEMRQRLAEVKGIENVFIGTIHSYANSYIRKYSKVSLDENNPKYFDEMLKKATVYCKLFTKENPKFVLIDEFQDVGELEYNFIIELKAQSYFLVGDDFQNLFAFKGSDVKYFIGFINDPNFTTYYLTNNYRCCSEIVKIAQKIISQVPDKIEKDVVIKNKTTKGTVEVLSFRFLKQYLRKIDKSSSKKDWFILTRSNRDLDTIYSECKKMKIPSTTFKRSELTLEDLDKIMKENTVKILTVHTAKGLQAPNVILYGNFPIVAKYGSAATPDERRVMYVGCTRAEQKLYIMNH